MQLSGGPAAGATLIVNHDATPEVNARTPAPAAAVLKPAHPVLGAPVRPVSGAPAAGSPVTRAPITRGGSTSVAPRKRPNVQGPGTFAGTASLNFTPASQYVGYSVTAAGTITPAAGYTYEIMFGDGTTAPIPLAANAASTNYSFAHTYATTDISAPEILATDANANSTLIAVQPISLYTLTGTVSNVYTTPGTASTITFTGSIPPMNPPAAPAITIDFGDGTPTAASTFAASVSIQHTYAVVGNYAIKVTATATGATIATGAAAIENARVANDNGTITASPPNVYQGTAVTISGSAPNNPFGATQTITFGDGSQSAAFPDGGTYSFTHTYAAAGTFTASVAQANGNGGTTTLESATVSVDPLTGGVSGSGVPGSPATIAFNGNVPTTNAPAPPPITIAFGDGQTATSTFGAMQTFAHTYPTAGTYTLTVTSGAITVATGTANIAGPLDTIVASPAAIYSGSSGQFTYTYQNPTPEAPPACVIDYGDGSTTTFGCQSMTFAHTYRATSQTVETIRVSTQNDAVNATTTTLTVDPLGGTISSSPVMQGTASSIAFAGVVPAGNPPPPPQVTINFGDGQTTMVTYGTATVAHTYAQAGTYTVTASANGTTIATGSAVVNPPALTVSAPPATYTGTPVTFNVTDPAATGAASTCSIAFGDGSTQTFTCGTFSVAHTYNVTANATETVTVSALDANGAAVGTPATTSVNVVVPAASVALSSPTIFSGSIENATITTDAIAGVAGPTMTLDWGDGSTPTTGLAFQNQVVSHSYARIRSLGTNHSYVAPGTYTLRLYDAAGTLATMSVTVVTPTATVAVSNANIIPGNVETVTLTVGALSGLAGPALTVDYGDGAAQVVTYANATLQHTYTAAGTYTITVSDPSGSLATQPVRVFQPSATISLNPSPVLAGQTTTVSVNLTPIGTAVGPAPLTLNFGDGTSTTLPSYTNASYAHTYAQIGTYALTLSAPGFGTIGSNVLSVVRQGQALLVPPAPVAANAPADIVVNVTPPAGFAVTPLELEYGDGSSIIVQSTGTYPHVYAKPGIYTVTLVNTSTGLAISTQQVTIEGVTPRVPIGQIYSSSFTNSPVLAGGETNILIQWSAAVPSLGTILDPIEGYVDLLDAKGKLVRRSDPFEIPGDSYSGPGVHTSQIPYDTPVDAHGTYQTRVILRSTQGGTITVGPPATLIIIGGPDPSIKVGAQFHDTGSVEIGPHAGQPGATFDPGMSLGFLSPTYSGTVSGIFDPISRRSDPLITVKSGANQTAISGPDASPAPAPAAPAPAAPAPAASAPAAPAATAGAPGPAVTAAGTAVPGTPPSANFVPGSTPAPQPSPVPVPAASGAAPDQRAFAIPDRAAAYATPAVPVAGPVAATAPPAPATSADPVPHNYTQLGGRGQATLPDALGGGSTLRGLDLSDSLGPVTYQVGYGYTALATASTSAERGAIGDISRTVGSDGLVRVTYFGRQDDPFHYPLMSGETGPLVTDSELLQFNAPTFDGFKIGLSGALSSAHGLQVEDYRTDDAADKFDLSYTHNAFTTAFNYHNAGPLFAVGSGPGAAADRVGGTGALSTPLTKFLNLSLNYSTDQARSAFSRQTDAGSTLAFTLPAQSTLSIAIKRDTQVAPTANTRNDSGTAAIGTHIGIGTLALNAGVSSAQDLISSINDAITRTGSIQYALQSNGHSFGFGVNATEVQQRVALPVPMTTATPDPTIGSPTTTTATGGVGSSMVSPVTGPGGNAQVGETMTYGFPFGGRVVNGAIVHGLELQLSASNSNSHAQGTGGYDQALSGILSYHLSAHLALGLRTEENWHGDILPANRTKSSAIRLRLDLTQ